MSYDNENAPVEAEAKAIVKAEPPKKPSAVATARNLDELPLADAAKVLMSSGLVRSGEDIGKILTKLSLGRDLGLPAVTSLNGIHVGPNSSIILSATLMRLLVNRSGKYKVRVKQRDLKGAAIEVFERMQDGSWESMGVPITFGPDDAKRAGLDKKETYVRWPADMYYARCLSAAFKVYMPDCAGGNSCYLPEEIDGSGMRSTEDGDMVPDAEFEPKPRSKLPVTATVISDDYSAAAIKKFAADNGITDLKPFAAHYSKDSMDKLTDDERKDMRRKLEQRVKASQKPVAAGVKS